MDEGHQTFECTKEVMLRPKERRGEYKVPVMIICILKLTADRDTLTT